MAQDLKIWNPEDQKFWKKEGKKIAIRNLCISIPSLFCGFAVWMCWSIITVQMLSVGFPFDKSQLFTLSAIAGLSGATLRIPSTFFIRLNGGRNTIFFTTALLLIPAIGIGFALQSMDTPLWIFQLLALLSGFGGGNFASSMSNISFFFPKKVQGLSLGLNAGLGNFGVTTMQILIPLVMTFALFGGEAMILKSDSGSLIGKALAGSPTYIFNAGFIWVLFLIPLIFATWFGMNNIKTEHVSPNVKSPISCFFIESVMLLIGFSTTIFGLWLMLPARVGGSGYDISKWLVLPIIIILTVALLKTLPGQIRTNLRRQYKIFKNKHTWAMTVIYSMTFGSFIGFAAAFPLAIKVIFGFSHVVGADGIITHFTPNPAGPNALMYAWVGPFIGAAVRPIGGILSDKFGGAKITQIISIALVAGAIGVAHYMKLSYASPNPEQYFMPFFLLFLVLFLASGIGNGSTFRTVAVAFDKEQAGPVLGWTSAVAAYGAFIIPQVFGEQITAATPENALYGFTAFYVVCIAINWWFYLRKNAYIKNP